MNAETQTLLQAVEAHGGSLQVEGSDLVVEAPQPLPDDLVARLRAAKPELLRTLTSATWDRDDWAAFYDERAAVLEHDHELPRGEAEAHAWEMTIIEWLRQNPEPAHRSDICAYCGDRMTDVDGVPVLRSGGGHTWLHSACWRDWYDGRRQMAEAALDEMQTNSKKGLIQ